MTGIQAAQVQEACVTELKAEQAQATARLRHINSPNISISGLDMATEYALGQQLAQKLRRIERALERAREGAYGHCEDCGQQIWERLLVLPDAERCVECQHRTERNLFRQVRRQPVLRMAA